MASLWRTLTFTWRGQEHSFTPSLDLLNLIESRGVNLMQLAQALSSNSGALLVQGCRAFAAILNAAGVKETADTVYLRFTTDAQRGGDARVRMMEDRASLALAFISAVIPEVDPAPNPEAPDPT